MCGHLFRWLGLSVVGPPVSFQVSKDGLHCPISRGERRTHEICGCFWRLVVVAYFVDGNGDERGANSCLCMRRTDFHILMPNPVSRAVAKGTYHQGAAT